MSPTPPAPRRPLENLFVETYAMVLPSWLQAGAPAEFGSPVRAMVPLALPAAVASTSIQVRTLLGVCADVLSYATITRRSPVDQCACEKVEMPRSSRASEALAPAPRYEGGAPIVPASGSMSAMALEYPLDESLSVKPTYWPPGTAVWQPMHVVVDSVT